MKYKTFADKKKPMLKPNQSPKAYFIYFVGCANAVLNCTKETIKELFPNSVYCYLDYYDHKNDYHEIALEMRIDAATLLCYFDENDKCNACFVCFDNADDINTYIELCNHLFEYNPTSRLWVMHSTFMIYRADEEETNLAFFSMCK